MLTFEKVDKLVRAADLTPFEPKPATAGTAAAMAAAPADRPVERLKQVCAIYQVVRPILELVAGLPLLPGKWRAAVRTFVRVLDTLCP